MTSMLAFEVPQQVVLSGAMRGLAFGVLAVGVILIYRSSRVINFALGELGALAAALMARLVVNWNWHYYPALVLTVAVGALLGGVIDVIVVRRLAKSPRVVLLVATIGVAQLLLLGQVALPDIATNTSFPTAFEQRWQIGSLIVRADHVVAAVVLPLIVAGLAFFLNRTRYGMFVRAAAVNADATRLAGISVKRVSTIVWCLAGGLAAVATILSAPLAGATSASLGDLGPSMLLRTFAVAVIAGMSSLVLAIVAGIGLGILEAVIFYNNTGDPGVVNAVLFVVVLVAVLVVSLRTKELGTRERLSFAPRVRPIPRQLQRHWIVRNQARLGALLALALAIALPLVVTESSRQFLYSRVLLMALVALSLTVLTGWAGQLSLGQFALTGVGAMTTYALVQNRLVYPAAVLGGVIAASAVAVLIGAPALRMRGLFLAITTLAFAVAAPWFFTRSVFVGDNSFLLLRRPVVGGVDLGDQRTFYYVCLGAMTLGVVAASRLRRSGVGRRLLAVRDNEVAAAAIGISPARTKLLAFAISGILAGLAGGLLAGLLVQFRPETQFAPTASLNIVAIAVIGGLSSIAGTVLGSLVIIGIPALFPGNDEIALLTSGAGMLLLLMYFPGGLVGVLYRARDAVLAFVAARMEEVPPPARRAVPARVSGLATRRKDTDADMHAVSAEGVSVRFGTRVVVDQVSLEVQRGEVVGLIGANGAGKSTLMNAIGGFVPSSGVVRVLGTDVSGRPAHRRADAGLGRTFQDAGLFPDLTVRETVATAVERRAHAGAVSVVVGLPGARRQERAKQAQTDEILHFLGLGPFAERFISELSTGTRRIVELACLLAAEAQVLCLDEPTAGIAQRETEAFGPLLLRVRDELEASMLVIEHDMPFVMGISSRVYCLDLGRVISCGPPAVVRNDPAVVAAYLGTDEAAIARSGIVAPRARA
jgi:ABC-type branched-subunit amino acid transport system ATPase component/ABC-type branched-subunit amino acid transport system permease subunit